MAGQTVIVSVLADTRRFNSAMAGTDKVLARFENGLRRISTVGVTTFSALAYASARFVQVGVKGAADLESAQLGLLNVFGDQAAKVEQLSLAWDKTGLSTRNYLKNANALGKALSATGKSTSEVVDYTDRLIGLGADLAATYGGTTEDAIYAFNSALIGEYDGLQRLIPTISAATVEAYALKAAHKESAKELTQAEKAMGAYLAIIGEAQVKQGAFGDNTEGFNVQLQRLTAVWQNTSDSIFRVVLTKLGPALETLITTLDEFGKSKDGQEFAKNLADSIELIAQQLPSVLKGFSSFIKYLNDSKISILDFAVNGFFASQALGVLSQNLGGLYQLFSNQKAISALATEVSGLNYGLGEGAGLVEFWEKKVKNLERRQRQGSKAWQEATDQLAMNRDGMKRLTKSYDEAAKKALGLGTNIDALVAKNAPLVGSTTIIGKMGEFFRAAGGTLLNLVKGLGTAVKFLGKMAFWVGIALAAWEVLKGVFQGFTETLDSVLGGKGKGMEGLMKMFESLQPVLDVINQVLQAIGYVIGTVIALAVAAIIKGVEFLVGLVKELAKWWDAVSGKQTSYYKNSNKNGVSTIPGSTYTTPSVPKSPGGNMAPVYNVTVNSLVPTAETGRVVMNSIRQYERTGGAR